LIGVPSALLRLIRADYAALAGAQGPAVNGPLRAVGGGAEDQVTCRRRFEQAHPEAVILPPTAGRWRAVVPPGLIPGDDTRTTLGAWDLEGLMDQLDAIYPPDGREPGDSLG
jgi:hypothetical protein